MFICNYLIDNCICQATNSTCIGKECECWNNKNCGIDTIEEKEEDSDK